MVTWARVNTIQIGRIGRIKCILENINWKDLVTECGVHRDRRVKNIFQVIVLSNCFTDKDSGCCYHFLWIASFSSLIILLLFFLKFEVFIFGPGFDSNFSSLPSPFSSLSSSILTFFLFSPLLFLVTIHLFSYFLYLSHSVEVLVKCYVVTGWSLWKQTQRWNLTRRIFIRDRHLGSEGKKARLGRGRS